MVWIKFRDGSGLKILPQKDTENERAEAEKRLGESGKADNIKFVQIQRRFIVNPKDAHHLKEAAIDQKIDVEGVTRDFTEHVAHIIDTDVGRAFDRLAEFKKIWLERCNEIECEDI